MYLNNDFIKLGTIVVWEMAVLLGEFKTYLISGDKSFLIPTGGPAYRFVCYSKAFSFVLNAIKSSIIILLLFPFLHNLLGIKWSELLIILILSILIKILIHNLKWILLNSNMRFIPKIVNYILFFSLNYICFKYYRNLGLIKNNIFIWIVLIFLAFISFVVAGSRDIHWEKVIDREATQKAILMSFILQDVNGLGKITKKRSSIFTRGQMGFPFNPVGAIAVLFIKSFIRQKENISLFLQIIVISVLLLMSIPLLGIRLIAIFSVLALSCLFIRSLYMQFKGDLWLNLSPITYRDKIRGIQLGPSILVLVHATILYSIVFFEYLGMWCIPVASVVGFLTSHVYVKILFINVEAIIFRGYQ